MQQFKYSQIVYILRWQKAIEELARPGRYLAASRDALYRGENMDEAGKSPLHKMWGLKVTTVPVFIAEPAL